MHQTHPFIRSACCLLPILVLFGCSEDPALVAEHEKQKTRIADLELEISRLELKLSKAPPARSRELEEMKVRIAETETEIGLLETKVLDLGNSKRALEEELAEFRNNYPIR